MVRSPQTTIRHARWVLLFLLVAAGTAGGAVGALEGWKRSTLAAVSGSVIGMSASGLATILLLVLLIGVKNLGAIVGNRPDRLRSPAPRPAPRPTPMAADIEALFTGQSWLMMAWLLLCGLAYLARYLLQSLVRGGLDRIGI